MAHGGYELMSQIDKLVGIGDRPHPKGEGGFFVDTALVVVAVAEAYIIYIRCGIRALEVETDSCRDSVVVDVAVGCGPHAGTCRFHPVDHVGTLAVECLQLGIHRSCPVAGSY